MVYRINDHKIYQQTPTDSWKHSPKSKERVFDVKVPSLNKDSRIMTLGSCFAESIVNALREKSVNVTGPGDFVFYDDMITTTMALKEHFEWCCKNTDIAPEQFLLYPGRVSSGKNQPNLREEEALNALRFSKESVQKSDVVILTLGLSEVWYEEIEGVRRSVWKWPGRKASQELCFSVLSAQENCDNLQEIVDFIRLENKNCSIIFTLSPVPLLATFRKDTNISIANFASKSNIRSGIDLFFAKNTDARVFYWPSYEFVIQTENAWQQDEHHVKPEVVKKITDTFLLKTGIVSSNP